MFDLHIHCNCSHDSRESIDTICRLAIEKGLGGIALSDHADMGPCCLPDTYEHFARRAEEICRAQSTYGDRLRVWTGIEMAEYLYDIPLAERLLALTEYDMILGSVHYVPYDHTAAPYSAIDFSEKTDAWIHGFLALYFEKIGEMLAKVDIDVLSHLTCPLRYVNGKYHRSISLQEHMPAIEAILTLALSRGVALEVNTSGCDGGMENIMPTADILSLYRSLGGTRVTLGSDAHTASRVGIGFDGAKRLLRSLGFDSFLTFQRRKPAIIPL